MVSIAGFELREGAEITDLESWPSFAEWFEHQYGSPADPRDRDCKDLFEAYLAGAHWEWERRA